MNVHNISNIDLTNFNMISQTQLEDQAASLSNVENPDSAYSITVC